MARNKSQVKKKLLVKAASQNRRMPLFVVAKTNRKVRFNRLQRDWRSQKLKLKE